MEPTTKPRSKPTTVPTMEPTDPDLNEPFEEVIVQPKKAIFETRDIANSQNNMELYVKLHLREIIIFGLFLIIFTNTFSDLFEYRSDLVDKEISALFLDTSFYGNEEEEVTIKFNNIFSPEHFWKYLSGVMCEKLYNVPIAQEIDDNVLYVNKFLYRPRLRQVRIGDDKCGRRDHLNSSFKKCYASYTIADEDTSSFGLMKGTEWTYSDESTKAGVPYSTEIANYGGGGYYFDFPDTKAKAIEQIEHLRSNNWITHYTRAIFIDFAIYNYHLQTISVINLVFEVPAAGGIVTVSSFRTIGLQRYGLTSSTMTMIGMIIVVFFLLYYTLEEIFELYYHNFRYFSIFWNWIDFFIVVLGWECVRLSIIVLMYEPSPKLEEKYRRSNGTVFYDNLVSRHIYIIDLMGYLFFLVSIKVIKYSDVSRTLTIIYLSLDRCFKSILMYLVLMNIIMVTFGIFGYCIYGNQIEEFSTLKNTFLSANKILMRDFKFFILKTDYTTVFFSLYCCFTVFCLLGLLMAMVFHTYFDVDVEAILDGRKLYLYDLILIHIDHILELLKLHKHVERRREESLQKKLIGYYPYQDVYNTLKRSNFSDSETKAILDNFDIEPQITVHEDEARNMFIDIQDIPEDKRNESKSDVYWLTDRVKILEDSVTEANSKLDAVVKNLNSIKITKPPTTA